MRIAVSIPQMNSGAQRFAEPGAQGPGGSPHPLGYSVWLAALLRTLRSVSLAQGFRMGTLQWVPPAPLLGLPWAGRQTPCKSASLALPCPGRASITE